MVTESDEQATDQFVAERSGSWNDSSAREMGPTGNTAQPQRDLSSVDALEKWCDCCLRWWLTR